MDDSDLMSAPTRKPLNNVPPPRDLGSLEHHLWNKQYHESDLKPLKEEVRVLAVAVGGWVVVFFDFGLEVGGRAPTLASSSHPQALSSYPSCCRSRPPFCLGSDSDLPRRTCPLYLRNGGTGTTSREERSPAYLYTR